MYLSALLISNMALSLNFKPPRLLYPAFQAYGVRLFKFLSDDWACTMDLVNTNSHEVQWGLSILKNYFRFVESEHHDWISSKLIKVKPCDMGLWFTLWLFVECRICRYPWKGVTTTGVSLCCSFKCSRIQLQIVIWYLICFRIFHWSGMGPMVFVVTYYVTRNKKQEMRTKPETGSDDFGE